jgi:hypothetical protein
MKRAILLVVALSICAPAATQATVTISVGNHLLLPNTPGQVIDIIVSSDGEGLNAMDMYLDVNGGIGPAPLITGFNLQFAPTVWAAQPNTPSVYGAPYEPPPGTLVFSSGVFLNSLAVNVSGNGIVAQIEFDTTGLLGGVFPVRLQNDDWGPTVLATNTGPLDPVLVNGSVVIGIPEPGSMVLGLLAVAALGIVASRSRPLRKGR